MAERGWGQSRTQVSSEKEGSENTGGELLQHHTASLGQIQSKV